MSTDPVLVPSAAQLRRLLRQAIGENARDTWCRLHGISDPQNVSSFLHGKVARPPRKVYEVLGFIPPPSAPRLSAMRAALRRLKAKAAEKTESVRTAL